MSSAVFPFLSPAEIKNDTLILFTPATDGNSYYLQSKK